MIIRHVVWSVPCGLVISYWGGGGGGRWTGLVALLCVVFICVFVAFACGVLGRVCVVFD